MPLWIGRSAYIVATGQGIARLSDEADQIFRWVNPAFAAFAHKPVEDFVARSYYEVFPFIENPNPRLLGALERFSPVPTMAMPYRPPSLPGSQ